MFCDQARVLMDRYVCEDLSPDERVSLEAHLGKCRDCRQQTADLRTLVATLQCELAPPVPEEFVVRLMARAQRERRPFQPFSEVRRTFHVWWVNANPASLANAVTAVAAGLLIGIVLGQQTWEHASQGGDRPTAHRDAGMIDSLDYLSGYPGNTVTQTYLSLTNAGNAQEI